MSSCIASTGKGLEMKYTLMITESETYFVEDIEAESEGEAFEKALDLMEKKGKDSFHNDSHGNYEVV